MITRRNLFVEKDVINNHKNAAIPSREETNYLKTNKSQNGILEQQSNGQYYHNNYNYQVKIII